jgi:hypothetical protein
VLPDDPAVLDDAEVVEEPERLKLADIPSIDAK